MDQLKEFKLVTEWRCNDTGMPGRQYRQAATPSVVSAARDLEVLCLLGCGAWSGRTVCGEEPRSIVMGGLGLYFGAFRTIHSEDGPVLVVTCERHTGTLDRVRRDMPRSLRRDQDREFHKLLRRLGFADLEQACEVRVIPLLRLGLDADAACRPPAESRGA